MLLLSTRATEHDLLNLISVTEMTENIEAISSKSVFTQYLRAINLEKRGVKSIKNPFYRTKAQCFIPKCSGLSKNNLGLYRTEVTGVNALELHTANPISIPGITYGTQVQE